MTNRFVETNEPLSTYFSSYLVPCFKNNRVFLLDYSPFCQKSGFSAPLSFLDVEYFRDHDYFEHFIFYYRNCRSNSMLELIEPVSEYEWFDYHKDFSYSDFYVVHFGF